MCNKIHFNTTTCPFCGEDCGSHTGLIAHMIKCVASRDVNWNSGIVAIGAAAIIALSMLTPAKAQSIGDPPADRSHVIYLPLVKSEDLVEGQPGGGPAHGVAVSWCPGCTEAAL